MEETIDIINLQYVQDRKPLLELTEEETSIRRPSTEILQKDRGTLLLLRYNRLQAGLSQRRSDIWKTVEFNDVDANGIITLRAYNSGKFATIQKEIHAYLEQIAAIEKAFIALNQLGAPFDNEINQKIQKVEYRIRQLHSMIESLKHSTRAEDNQPKILVAEKELHGLEKELAKDQTIKAKINQIFDNLMFEEATRKEKA